MTSSEQDADGSVTLIHGEALSALRELPGDSVDAVVTDPPFKLSQEYGTTTDPDNLLAVSSLWPVAVEMARVAKPGALCAMFYDTRILPLALAAMREGGWKYLRALTLYRRWGNASLLHGWMTTSDFILIFVRPGAKPAFYGNAAHDVYVRDKAETEAFGHPAQKPLVHCRHIVSRVTPPGGITLDPYMGSGTTGVAAVLESRGFVGVEMSDDYFGVATRRIEARLREVQDADTLTARLAGVDVTSARDLGWTSAGDPDLFGGAA
jgi:site-specific DNA-methyltransferase (adenine-specific)